MPLALIRSFVHLLCVFEPIGKLSAPQVLAEDCRDDDEGKENGKQVRSYCHRSAEPAMQEQVEAMPKIEWACRGPKLARLHGSHAASWAMHPMCGGGSLHHPISLGGWNRCNTSFLPSLYQG